MTADLTSETIMKPNPYATTEQNGTIGRNSHLVQQFLRESDQARWHSYFAADGQCECSKSVFPPQVTAMSPSEWVESLPEKFQFQNQYGDEGITPIFLPVVETWQDSILAKACSVNAAGGQEFWILEFSFDRDGKIVFLKLAVDHDEQEYLQMRQEGCFSYDSAVDGSTRRILNLHTINLWWDTVDEDRNIQRRILVTDDAVKLMHGVRTKMYVTDENGTFVAGWLNPDQSQIFPKWGFYGDDLASQPSKTFFAPSCPMCS